MSQPELKELTDKFEHALEESKDEETRDLMALLLRLARNPNMTIARKLVSIKAVLSPEFGREEVEREAMGLGGNPGVQGSYINKHTQVNRKEEYRRRLFVKLEMKRQLKKP